jgi:hypothetical protein
MMRVAANAAANSVQDPLISAHHRWAPRTSESVAVQHFSVMAANIG